MFVTKTMLHSLSIFSMDLSVDCQDSKTVLAGSLVNKITFHPLQPCIS